MAGGKRYPVPPCRHKIKGYLSHVGAACCAQAAPAFCSPSSLQSGAYSCILFAQYKTNGGKAMRFLLKLLFAPILAVLAVVTWFFVFVVQPVQRHPLHPRRHSRLLRSVHHLCGFRQLRRGAAGDRVPHKPLRAAHAGGLAGGSSMSGLRDSGQDLQVNILETRKTFQKPYFAQFQKRHITQQARGDIAPRFLFYSISILAVVVCLAGGAGEARIVPMTPLPAAQMGAPQIMHLRRFSWRQGIPAVRRSAPAVGILVVFTTPSAISSMEI